MKKLIAISRCHSHQLSCQLVVSDASTITSDSASSAKANAIAKASLDPRRAAIRKYCTAANPYATTPIRANTPSAASASSGATVARSGGSSASDSTAHSASNPSTAPTSARAWRMIASEVRSGYSIAEAAASSPATTSPTGVASTNPALPFSSSTPGVASACSPRNPALARNASPISSSRASFRRRPASLTATASPALTTPATSTIQKCAGWSSHRASSDGAARSSTITAIGSASAVTIFNPTPLNLKGSDP